MPIITAILLYHDSGWAHSFNATKRLTQNTLDTALGKEQPTSLDQLVVLLDNIISYGVRRQAICEEHVAGAWRLVALMYRAHVNEKLLLENILEAMKTWIEVSHYDYKQALKGVSIKDIIASTANESRITAKAAGWPGKPVRPGQPGMLSDNIDTVPIRDVVYVLGAFLAAEHQGCGLCFSTLHGISQCPRAWHNLIRASEATGVLNEQELGKLKGAAVVCVASVFAGVENPQHVVDWNNTLRSAKSINKRASFGIRMIQGLESVPDEPPAYTMQYGGRRGGHRGRGRFGPRGRGRNRGRDGPSEDYEEG